MPSFPGNHAIWGATGQDSSGHIWFGVTSDIPAPAIKSAHLIEYDPESSTATDRGNVVTELRRAELLEPGEQQAKIHSRIVEGSDNHLYFASMDEDGERSDGSKLPTWGGHLWRLDLGTKRWEHLLETPEALIAVGQGGRFVYALGYFGHVLYQYDTRDGRTRRIDVGSVDGHISRNFLVDDRGHAYVPRLTVVAGAEAGRQVRASLVEFDTSLRELRETPLSEGRYLSGNPTGSHGITGLQKMADGSLFFTTHLGLLAQVRPPADAGAADVREVGWLHPEGSRYAPTLFSENGRTSVSAAVPVSGQGGPPYEWVICDGGGTNCRSAPLTLPLLNGLPLQRMLLYGSATSDARGGHYVVGSSLVNGSFRPLVLRIQGQ